MNRQRFIARLRNIAVAFEANPNWGSDIAIMRVEKMLFDMKKSWVDDENL